jgi:hypothetical protein
LETLANHNGFHALEIDGDRHWLWTNGAACLDLPVSEAANEALLLDLHVIAAQRSWLAPPIDGPKSAPDTNRRAFTRRPAFCP